MNSKFIKVISNGCFLSAICLGAGFLSVSEVLGYAQSSYYSQNYYQSYYQADYYSQTYYQSTYGVNFSTDVLMNSTLFVIGGISKGSGSFVIDHPLDPQNKLLYHSFVESPDAKNIYDGLATLDKNGEVEITLPLYFEALNTGYRYQVNGINNPSPDLHIKEEIVDNKFTVSGGVPNSQISWQVTGIRHDPYILANPIINEVEKGPDELVDKGEFLFSGYEGLYEKNDWFTNLMQQLSLYWERLVNWLVFWK